MAACQEMRSFLLQSFLFLLGTAGALTACSSKDEETSHAGGANSGGQGGDLGGGSTGGTTGSGGALGGGGTPTASAVASCEEPSWDPADFDVVYDVGPGHDLETPSDVPWESMGPGTLVRIHRRAQPYADKWVLAVSATAEAPVVVLGVPQDGLLPEITGEGAVTRQALSFWSEQRGVIKVGGSSTPDLQTAEHIVIECLDISGARASNGFTDDGGESQNYSDNASAIFVESGRNITIRNNRLHDSGNGLFIAWETWDTLVSGNQIFGNGNVDSIYEHNNYNEGHGIVYEFNEFGALCDGCPGSNLKDRSSGVVIRYNWIYGGNRALDIVDSSYESIRMAPGYHDTFVYGNVLIEPDDGGNRQLVHYGGDNSSANFRSGTLHFFHNTVVSERSGLFSMVRLSSPDATLDARNNIIYALNGGSQIAILEDVGTALLQGNWLQTGWNQGTPSLTGTVTDMNNHEANEPGFVDANARQYHLTETASARDITTELAEEAAAHAIEWQYAEPASATPRDATRAAGALE